MISSGVHSPFLERNSWQNSLPSKAATPTRTHIQRLSINPRKLQKQPREEKEWAWQKKVVFFLLNIYLFYLAHLWTLTLYHKFTSQFLTFFSDYTQTPPLPISAFLFFSSPSAWLFRFYYPVLLGCLTLLIPAVQDACVCLCICVCAFVDVCLGRANVWVSWLPHD